MKDASGSASAPSAGGNSLAITERQKPAPSCVAALFQMFAKRKLFSSPSKKNKLLPPVRAQKFSPGRPAGGGLKTPAAKTGRPLLLDSADYSRSDSEGNGTNRLPPSGQDQSCSEMCTPGVVARLMGLNSMPAVSHQRPTKATDSSKLVDHRNAGSQDWSGTSQTIYTSPQNQQKTGQLTDERQHDNAIQFSAQDIRPLWPRKHAHKVASPVRSPRSMSSRNKARLIEAAAKVLEPGLQSRSRRHSRRHAYLEYSCNGTDIKPAAAALHNLADPILRDTQCDVDTPRLGAHHIGAPSLQNSTSNQLTEEVGKSSIPVRTSGQNVSCQMQPEGNVKCLLTSPSEKPGFRASVQRTSDRTGVTCQDVRKNQKRNIFEDSAPCGPLKQNNLKQNALPVPCEVTDPGHMVRRHKNRSGERNATNTAPDFVSLNKRMTSTSLRSKRKAMDRFTEPHTSAQNKTLSTKGRRTSLHSDSSNKLKLKTATPKAMEKDMKIAKGAGLVSEKPKSDSPKFSRGDLHRQALARNASGCKKNSDITSFRFSSPMKVAPTSLPDDNAILTGCAIQGYPVGIGPKRRSRRDCQATSSQRDLDFREVIHGTSSLEAAESVFVNQDELQNREIPGGRAAFYLFEKTSATQWTVESLSDEQLWQCNSMDNVTLGFSNPSKPAQLRGTHRKREAETKSRNPSPSISRDSNKQRPTPILRSTCEDNAFISGIALSTAEGASTDSYPTKPCTVAVSMQDGTTERNSRCAEPNLGQHGAQPFKQAVQDSKLTHPGDVTSTVELLLSNVSSSTPHKSIESSKRLLRAVESALSTLTTGAKQDFRTIKAEESSPLRDLAIDYVIELLDSMCVQLCDSGYRSFPKLDLICTEERLAAEVKKEIARCSDMAGRDLDDLAVSEVEHAMEAGMNSMLEAFQIGAQIEQDLIQEVVNEIGIGRFERL